LEDPDNDEKILILILKKKGESTWTRGLLTMWARTKISDSQNKKLLFPPPHFTCYLHSLKQRKWEKNKKCYIAALYFVVDPGA
jgi:hypothetical protein